MITLGLVHYSLINIDCHSKVILLLKLQKLSDPDRISLTHVSVTYTDYRNAFFPTVIVTLTFYGDYKKNYKRPLFKSDRGALSAKESREMLLTTRSSSERSFYSVVLMSGDS